MIAQILAARAAIPGTDAPQVALFVANDVDPNDWVDAVRQTLPNVTSVEPLPGSPSTELLRGVAPGTLRIWMGEERFEAL